MVSDLHMARITSTCLKAILFIRAFAGNIFYFFLKEELLPCQIKKKNNYLCQYMRSGQSLGFILKVLRAGLKFQSS